MSNCILNTAFQCKYKTTVHSVVINPLFKHVSINLIRSMVYTRNFVYNNWVFCSEFICCVLVLVKETYLAISEQG
jgi:hypothetical protein